MYLLVNLASLSNAGTPMEVCVYMYVPMVEKGRERERERGTSYVVVKSEIEIDFVLIQDDGR